MPCILFIIKLIHVRNDNVWVGATLDVTKIRDANKHSMNHRDTRLASILDDNNTSIQLQVVPLCTDQPLVIDGTGVPYMRSARMKPRA